MTLCSSRIYPQTHTYSSWNQSQLEALGEQVKADRGSELTDVSSQDISYLWAGPSFNELNKHFTAVAVPSFVFLFEFGCIILHRFIIVSTKLPPRTWWESLLLLL